MFWGHKSAAQTASSKVQSWVWFILSLKVHSGFLSCTDTAAIWTELFWFIVARFYVQLFAPVSAHWRKFSYGTWPPCFRDQVEYFIGTSSMLWGQAVENDGIGPRTLRLGVSQRSAWLGSGPGWCTYSRHLDQTGIGSLRSSFSKMSCVCYTSRPQVCVPDSGWPTVEC